MTRFARWYDARPVAGDSWLAGLLLVVFVLPSELAAEDDVALGMAFSVALVACVPLRRRAPVGVFVAVSVLCLVQFAVLDRIVAGDVVALIAVYTLVAYAPGTRLRPSGRRAPSSARCWPPHAGTTTTGVSRLQVVATTVISVLLAATLGAWRRSRRAQLAALEDRNRLLALERDQQAAVGAAIERARIARELHDVVAHSLSVIVVQADGAAAGAAQRPEAAASALSTIGDTGRDALGQMRRLLGVLRSDEAAARRWRPSPARPSWTRSSHRSRARACRPACRWRATRGPLNGTIGVTVYRLAQEALTNVLKHAGPVMRSTSCCATATTPSNCSCATTAAAAKPRVTARATAWWGCASASTCRTAR